MSPFVVQEVRRKNNHMRKRSGLSCVWGRGPLRVSDGRPAGRGRSFAAPLRRHRRVRARLPLIPRARSPRQPFHHVSLTMRALRPCGQTLPQARCTTHRETTHGGQERGPPGILSAHSG
ncbi:hypothetical protein AAFF_G00049050 [Aldrovandia affinis]|uniref:Uncharacterized protein n=1 Tax=Aldrovandia affinis TaxID=143900 RepID=A0AAD7S1D6_9TELE|nr:hypothetical protein AAFF_G00049050 [Aldrovandia affinis]